MVGYPYFYGNNNLNEEGESFMIFSLGPISKDSELDLVHLSLLSIY